MRIDSTRESRPFAGSSRQLLLLALAAGLLSLVMVAAASARRAKPYRGKTAQGLRVRVSPKRSFGRTFSYQVRMACSDGTTFTDGVFFDDVGVRRGRFHDRYRSDRGAVTNTVVGKLRGKRASGRLRVIERYSANADASGAYLPLDPKGTVVCDSGSVRWSARK